LQKVSESKEEEEDGEQEQSKSKDSEKAEVDEETSESKNLSVAGQLQLLLDNLQKNTKLNKHPSDFNFQRGGKHGGFGGPAQGHSFPGSQGRAEGEWAIDGQGTQLITNAYSMINEVIMHPTIMWNRQFFYSLGAMQPREQQLMHEWFLEMNEKQKIYIKEIERANDQLKQTAARMFTEKGYSQE